MYFASIAKGHSRPVERPTPFTAAQLAANLNYADGQLSISSSTLPLSPRRSGEQARVRRVLRSRSKLADKRFPWRPTTVAPGVPHLAHPQPAPPRQVRIDQAKAPGYYSRQGSTAAAECVTAARMQLSTAFEGGDGSFAQLNLLPCDAGSGRDLSEVPLESWGYGRTGPCLTRSSLRAAPTARDSERDLCAGRPHTERRDRSQVRWGTPPGGDSAEGVLSGRTRTAPGGPRGRSHPHRESSLPAGAPTELYASPWAARGGGGMVCRPVTVPQTSRPSRQRSTVEKHTLRISATSSLRTACGISFLPGLSPKLRTGVTAMVEPHANAGASTAASLKLSASELATLWKFGHDPDAEPKVCAVVLKKLSDDAVLKAEGEAARKATTAWEEGGIVEPPDSQPKNPHAKDREGEPKRPWYIQATGL